MTREFHCSGPEIRLGYASPRIFENGPTQGEVDFLHAWLSRKETYSHACALRDTFIWPHAWFRTTVSPTGVDYLIGFSTRVIYQELHSFLALINFNMLNKDEEEIDVLRMCSIFPQHRGWRIRSSPQRRWALSRSFIEDKKVNGNNRIIFSFLKLFGCSWGYPALLGRTLNMCESVWHKLNKFSSNFNIPFMS